jgi:hypothetical protein
MSVWKEIRCDAIPEIDDCLSRSNEGPKGFETVTELHRQARLRGWRISRDQAICPNCK